MSGFQKFLLVLVAIAVTVLMLVSWGSIGSALCAFLLIILAVSLLYRRFVLERDPDDFNFEE